MNLSRPYPWAGALILLIVLAGFWPTYYGPLIAGELDTRATVHLHSAVFLGWVLLLIVQASLVAKDRSDIHQKLGVAGLALGFAVVVMGVWVSLDKASIEIAAGNALEAQQFLLTPLTSIALFAGFLALAAAKRKKPRSHKRLMMLATVSMLDAPISRMGFIGDPPNPLLLMLVWFSPIVFLMVVDRVQVRKFSWLYVAGLLVMVISGARFPLSQTEGWIAIARVLTGSP